ncbi:uncharacterized protein [Paramormyrops kingsleyae]|uniref:uncharacterized protein isoform X3 n=1 Tax=Paramormyrops kingsleyae TaxID=1676925 RepID=UPI003B96B795
MVELLFLLGIRYLSVAEHFPLSRLELWCKDGVHLSDNVGMEILTWLLWDAASLQLQAATPDAPASPKTSPPVERPVPPNLVVAAPSKAPATLKTSPPVVRRVSPKLVVVGEVTVPRASNPFDWTLVQQKRQRVQGEHTQESRRMAGQQTSTVDHRRRPAASKTTLEEEQAHNTTQVHTATTPLPNSTAIPAASTAIPAALQQSHP